MREPVRSAPPPPGGRPTTIIRPSSSSDSITKRSVLDAVGPRAAPARPARGPAPTQPPAPRRAGVRPPPKKKPPPRPPPPKFQEFSRRDTPPTYEQVLREDAAVLAGFGFGGERTTTPSAPPLGADLIDFDAPAPAPPLPAVPLTWDSPPPARRPAPTAAPAAAPALPQAAAAPIPAVTVIRPAKSTVRRAPRQPELPVASASDTRDASPPMPSCPPPPPPKIGWVAETPTMRPPTPPPRPGSSASGTEPPQATALYDFQSGESGDLSFSADETIYLVERVNAEWLRGRCGARQGIFPEAYVRITEPLPGEPEPEPETEPESESEQGDGALVLYDFAAQEASDLALTAGERVQVQGRLNDEWGYGTVAGRSGQFPLAYVDVRPEQLPML